MDYEDQWMVVGIRVPDDLEKVLMRDSDFLAKGRFSNCTPGLAIPLMAGKIAPALLTRMTVPVLSYLSERGGGSYIKNVLPMKFTIKAWQNSCHGKMSVSPK